MGGRVGEVFQVQELYRHSLISRENCLSSVCWEREKSQWHELSQRRFFTLIHKICFFFQSVLESLPGVDPQSDAVRQAVGAMSKSSTSKKDTDKKDDKDGKK